MDTASTREYAGKKILELGATNPDLCVVGADLNKSTFTNLFAEKYPDRFFDVGPYNHRNLLFWVINMFNTPHIMSYYTFELHL